MKRRGEQPWRTNRARVLRANQTSAEDKLWDCLRAKRLAGLKFVRQWPIGPYVADFACRSKKIIVEVDGATHGTTEERSRDAVRSAYFEAQGFRVFRAHNQEIFDDIDGVVNGLVAFIGSVE